MTSAVPPNCHHLVFNNFQLNRACREKTAHTATHFRMRTRRLRGRSAGQSPAGRRLDPAEARGRGGGRGGWGGAREAPVRGGPSAGRRGNDTAWPPEVAPLKGMSGYTGAWRLEPGALYPHRLEAPPQSSSLITLSSGRKLTQGGKVIA